MAAKDLKAVQAGSGDADAAGLIAVARSLVEKKDNAGALDQAKRAAALDSCSPDVRLDAAGVMAAAGDKNAAVACYLDAGTKFLYDVGDMQKARAAFAQAHALDATNLDVIFQMGQADVVEGRTQDALAKFIDVLRKSNLKHVPALFEAGCIYQSNGQYDQAILAFKKVLDRDKDHVQAIVHMGQLHQTKGMVPESLAYYIQAAEIARESGQIGTAQQLLSMVLALDGANQKARFMLDDIADRSRELEEEAAVPEPPPVMKSPPAAAPQAAPAPPAAAAATQPAASAASAMLAGEREALARELEDMAGARLDAEAALARIKDEVEAAIKLRQQAEAERASAEREAATIAGALTERRAQLEDAARRKAELNAEAGATNAALHEAKKAQSELEAAAEKRRAQIEIELAGLTGKRAEIEAALKAANDALAASEAKRAQSEAAVGGAKETLAAAEARRAEIEAALKGSSDALAASEAKRAHSEAAVGGAKETLAAAEARRAEIEAALKSANDALAASEAKRAQTEAELKAGTASASSARVERERMDAEQRALAEQTAALAKQKAADETAATAAAAASKKAAAELAKLRSEIEAAAARLAQAQAEAETAAASRDQIRTEVAGAESDLDALRERVRSAQTSAADAEKLKKAGAQLKELESAASAASKKSLEATAAVEALEKRKQEIEESYARSKSLAAAADEKRVEAARAAEQAEALRSKREADAEALAARIATLEAALKDADARAKLAKGETAALQELTAKVGAQRKAMLDLEARKSELERSTNELETKAKALESHAGTLEARRAEEEARLAKLQEESAAASAALDAARDAGPELLAPRRRTTDESYADAVAASVPPESCAEALRSIESLAAEGEIPFEIAAELAGLIHEGRAVEALRVSRARANLEAKPAPYLLVVGDLARDLGDAAGAREAYRTLSVADPSRAGVVHQRLGQLFLTFADQGTAAALARDDAHYAAAQEPAKAIEAYAELVARFPDDPTFRQELGEIHERLGNAEAAGLAYTQAMQQYLGNDDAAKAVELVSHLLAVRPSSGDALELAARAYERAGRPAEAQRLLEEALAAYRKSTSAADMERVCRKLADIADDPIPYRRELASLLQEVGDVGGAAEQLLEGAEKLVERASAADALAMLREAAGIAGDNERLAERIELVKRKAVDAQGSVDDAARGAMFLAKKQYDKAADAYRSAVEKNPYHADACYQLACLLCDKFPDFPTAEQLLENAAELRPGHTATRYRLAFVKAERGDVEQAVELLVALARFDEHNADFIEQFVERLEKDADGGSVAAKYRLGIAYRELGRVEEALVILQSIQREADFIVLCLNAIGLCLRRQGLDTAAAKRFQKAIETPGYPETQYSEALYNLGDLYEAKHDPESLAFSLSSFEELYARDCTYRDIADRIKAVKAKLGAAEGPKVKRLPTRGEAANDR